ncbi:AraC family transcriptional regulator [Intestinibacillus massiliensis]|uniref:AraC family transcriptional regulator n=1 Tax=Intestinibacillus massiliensis TaxID=1871029 RepID=UPI000B34EDC4|nr:AraC family transcriptional regulator [Intestinibacillus massiliensis]MCB6365713.1 AraC family transcriptional regulator [Intestinibacillus massiliensis]
MKVLHEAGVLSQSERFFSTPSAIARRLFFYVTRCGHYYCDEHYDFKDTCDISQLESHKNFFLIYLRAGFMHFIADGDKFTAEQGQLALIDCRRPHRYYTPQGAETIWIHFDGANAADFYEQIIAFHGGRHVFYPPSDSRVERELAQIVSGLKGGASIPEVAYSQRIYQILCNLLFPQHAADAADADSPTAQAMRFIGEHLFEELSVERVAAAVNLSPSHFSRQFRSHTGFSPHEYIVLHRIDEAKALLHGTKLSVKEIAYRVGYHSEVNFIASFTDKVGVSPATFRKTPM